ncbi:glycosyltransferase family 2 protein [Methylophaga sulfidovorans]|uniref:Glycosyl transferase family 2 n=1 Tax=Methylophaga sulfidovorans TaxID=45496 RepID=A0A1I3YMW1_9GAMM|nr:glycosyltransferase family 2 protein [Methylophaga sulfidovorans]SFK33154.1 Glycosyl transferase family 2 [Methylophaga sulfidovorans]
MIKFTIITSTYNCADLLRKTADSIRNQTYPFKQWIIADGASEDRTLEVVNQNNDVVTNLISEPDTGIYQAWNRALKLIEGDWVIFLGAGDYFYSHQTLEKIAGKLTNIDQNIHLAYGDVHLIDKNDQQLCVYGQISEGWEFLRPKLPPHQGTFQRAKLFESEKVFDESYKIAADSKFLIKALVISTLEYLSEPIVCMDASGVSSNIPNTRNTYIELNRLRKEMNLSTPYSHRIFFCTYIYAKILAYRIFPKRLCSMLLQLKRRIFGFRF